MNCLNRSTDHESQKVTELRAELKYVIYLLEDESIKLHEVIALCNRLLVIRQTIEKLAL